MNCPLCNSGSKTVFAAKGFPVRDCAGCGHRFAEIETSAEHIAEVYDDSYFNGGGAGYADYLAEGAMLVERGRDYGTLLARYRAPGRILDAGAAAGFILMGFGETGWRGTGVEPNATMAKYGRENLRLEIFTSDLENFSATEKFDAAALVQVAAHLHDPRRAFENIRNLLVADGLLLVETWNCQSVTARVFRSHWHEYSPPSVLHWFSPKSLGAFLSGLGFAEVARGRPSKKISGAHARSLLRYCLGERFDPLLRFIPSKINFPYPAEDLFWALYRKK